MLPIFLMQIHVVAVCFLQQEFISGGYKMPAGHAILYMTYLAQRDPDVFDSPDEFKPGRWVSK